MRAAGDADALIAAVREHAPDIVVYDIRMPPDNTDDGLRAAVALRQEPPSTVGRGNSVRSARRAT